MCPGRTGRPAPARRRRRTEGVPAGPLRLAGPSATRRSPRPGGRGRPVRLHGLQSGRARFRALAPRLPADGDQDLFPLEQIGIEDDDPGVAGPQDAGEGPPGGRGGGRVSPCTTRSAWIPATRRASSGCAAITSLPVHSRSHRRRRFCNRRRIRVRRVSPGLYSASGTEWEGPTKVPRRDRSLQPVLIRK